MRTESVRLNTSPLAPVAFSMTGISALGIGFRNRGAESERGRKGDFISLLTDFTVSAAGFSSMISEGVSGGLGSISFC